jgi:hypothetical protein
MATNRGSKQQKRRKMKRYGHSNRRRGNKVCKGKELREKIAGSRRKREEGSF